MQTEAEEASADEADASIRPASLHVPDIHEHPLVWTEHPKATHSCDSQQNCSASSLAKAFYCKQCDFDLCEDCAKVYYPVPPDCNGEQFVVTAKMGASIFALHRPDRSIGMLAHGTTVAVEGEIGVLLKIVYPCRALVRRADVKAVPESERKELD